MVEMTKEDKDMIKRVALSTGAENMWLAEGDVGINIPQGQRYVLPLTKWQYEGVE